MVYLLFSGVQPKDTQHIHQYAAGFGSGEGHPENWPQAHMPEEIPQSVCLCVRAECSCMQADLWKCVCLHVRVISPPPGRETQDFVILKILYWKSHGRPMHIDQQGQYHESPGTLKQFLLTQSKQAKTRGIEWSWFFSITALCFTVCFPSRSSVSTFLPSSPVIRHVKTSTQLSTGQTRCMFSWQQEPQLYFLPSSFSIVSFFCSLCLPARTLSPPRVSIQFKPVSVYQTRRRSPNGRSQNIKCLTSSSFVWAAAWSHTHTEPQRRTPHTCVCLCCVTASQGRSSANKQRIQAHADVTLLQRKSYERHWPAPCLREQGHGCWLVCDNDNFAHMWMSEVVDYYFFYIYLCVLNIKKKLYSTMAETMVIFTPQLSLG